MIINALLCALGIAKGMFDILAILDIHIAGKKIPYYIAWIGAIVLAVYTFLLRYKGKIKYDDVF
jgi:phosphotransferase system  glucose/maltose/N-acetylglucosamine-specific IIC component